MTGGRGPVRCRGPVAGAGFDRIVSSNTTKKRMLLRRHTVFAAAPLPPFTIDLPGSWSVFPIRAVLPPVPSSMNHLTFGRGYTNRPRE